MQLKNRVSVVTGAGRGIGRGIALRMAEEGSHIALVDVLQDEVEETAEEIRRLGRRTLALCTDVSNSSQVAAMVSKTVDVLGKIDILVNNAGVMGTKPMWDITADEWDRMLAVNLKGPFLCSQAVVRHLLERGAPGKIVNVASVESEVAFPNSTHYAASKGGVAMLTKAMAYDLAPHGINVNAVGPGSTDTGSNYLDPKRRAIYTAIIPMGRLGTPLDVAKAAVFLASDQADYITGQILYVDGGLLTYKAPMSG